MPVLAAVALIMLMVLYAAPDAPGVRPLHRLVVVASARWLSRLSPAKILFAVGLGLVAWILIGLFAGEGVKLFSMMAPDTIIWFAMFDVATIVDAVLFGLVVSTSVRLGTAVRRVRTLLDRARDQITGLVRPRPRGRARADQPRTRPVQSNPPRTDDPAPAWTQWRPLAA